MRHIQGTSLPCGGCVLTIGKFEGIHLGHRILINKTIERGKELGLPSVVLAFEPHPYAALSQGSYKPIYTLKEKAYLLNLMEGLDYMIAYPFSEEFAKTTAEEFCRVIFESINAKEVYVGENFGFGSGREGSSSLLKKTGETYGAKVNITELYQGLQESGRFVSSSQIRKLIEEGRLSEANQQLGHPFFLVGETVSGRQLGRKIGFPTINILPSKEKLTPLRGVYATRIFIDGKGYDGITNVGINPTVSESNRQTVETHVLNQPDSFLSENFYGYEIMLEFSSFLRHEMKFSSKDALVGQINIDINKLLLQNW